MFVCELDEMKERFGFKCNKKYLFLKKSERPFEKNKKSVRYSHKKRINKQNVTIMI